MPKYFCASVPATRKARKNIGRKDFLPVESPPQADLSFLFLLGRTQVRLRPLLYQVSGHRQICFRSRGGLSSARVPSAAYKPPQHLPFQYSTRLVPRGSCAFPGLLPRVALLTLRFRFEKYAKHTFSTKTERRKNSGSSQSLASLRGSRCVRLERFIYKGGLGSVR
jgi:hypothetical protein